MGANYLCVVQINSKTRVLVTGGAGFIGSWLVHDLNQQGVEKIVVADFLGSDNKWQNLTPLAFERYLEASELLPALESNRLGSFDLVLHMGACSSTSERDASYLVSNNYEFTRRLAHWSLDKGARFVYASSAATYGNGSEGMDDTSDISYLRKLRPLNMYGYSKQLFDLYAAQKGLLEKCAGIKYFNVFGPNEQHKGEMRSLANKAYSQVKSTGTLKLFKSARDDYKDGEQKRDFIYVNDAAAMTLHLAASDDAVGLFNVGAGRAETWLDLANAIFAAMGRDPKIEFIDLPPEIRDGYQYLTLADISRLRSSGYEREVTPLADSVRDYVTNYLDKDRKYSG